MPMKVMGARRKYKVRYPTLYATEADCKEHVAFNCVQVRMRAAPIDNYFF